MTQAAPPPIKLSALRDIGWKEWDPIGILPPGEIWDHQPFADEYDRYLLAVAGGFRRGMSLEDATQYLLRAARQQMGLSPHPLQIEQASATARSIQRYMAELDGRSPVSA
ncbi:hypothetical protein [Bosea sp. (in: a-proteobacteria)]|uniref:hypothetical protein n=1 Tax=Bosea sp. (in: a-proteobacteria) TaxID=1871050 RepID=UPI0040341B18